MNNTKTPTPKTSSSFPQENNHNGPTTSSFNFTWNVMRAMVYFFGIISIITIAGSWISANQATIQAFNNSYVVTELGTFQATNANNDPGSRKIEVTNHIKTFLNYMYAFDERTFKSNIEAGLHLIGTDGKLILQGYTEGRVLEDLVKTSGVVKIKIDSIKTNMSRHPYYAEVYARQRFETPAGEQIFTLHCNMELRDVSRSSKNIHGLLIENFNILDNAIIEE